MDRLKAIADWLPNGRIGALVTAAVTRRYLTGFGEGGGIVIVTKEQCLYYTEAEHYEKAKQTVSGCRVVMIKNLRLQLMELMLNLNIRLLFIEPERMTVREYTELSEAVHCAEIEMSGGMSEMLAQLRAVKSEEEIALIRRAQGIADAAYKRFLSSVRRGMTEKQAAALLSGYILECGADGVPFPVSAASGENSALEHPKPTDRKLSVGDFLVLRFGAECGGYCSAVTRTIAVGEVGEVMEDVYNAAAAACSDAIAVIGAGRGCKLPYSVAKSTLNSWGGLDEHFGETLGCGIGAELNEEPWISRNSRGVLRSGMVVTVAPAVRIAGRFGVCIEDVTVVEENGCEILSNATKKLIHI